MKNLLKNIEAYESYAGVFPAEVIPILTKIVKEATDKGRDDFISKYNRELGKAYFRAGQFNECDASLQKSLKAAQKGVLKSEEVKTKLEQGELEFYRGLKESALNLFFEVLAYNSDKISAKAHVFIGEIYALSGKFKDSKDHLNKAIYLSEKFEDFKNLAFTYIGWSVHSSQKQSPLLALQYLEKSLLLSRDNNFHYRLGLTYFYTGQTYLKIGLHREAIRHFNDCSFICEKFGFSFLGLLSHMKFSDCLFIIEDYSRCLEYYDKGILEAKEQKIRDSILHGLEGKYKSLKGLKRAKEANSVLEELNFFRKDYQKIKEAALLEILAEKEKELQYLLEKNRAYVQQMDDLKVYQNVIAHEMRGPLRNIGSFSGLIKEKIKEKGDNQLEEFINYVLLNSEKMDGVILSFLDYLTLSTAEGSFKSMTIGKAVENAVNKIKFQIQENKVEITYEDTVKISGNVGMLSRVFLELLLNAIENKSKKPLKIKIWGVSSGELVNVFVKDNGSGLNDNQINHLFSVFHRNEKTPTSSGMGLATCRKIVQIHGGGIWLEESSEEGTTFGFSLKAI